MEVLNETKVFSVPSTQQVTIHSAITYHFQKSIENANYLSIFISMFSSITSIIYHLYLQVRKLRVIKVMYVSQASQLINRSAMILILIHQIQTVMCIFPRLLPFFSFLSCWASRKDLFFLYNKDVKFQRFHREHRVQITYFKYEKTETQRRCFFTYT